MTEASVTTRRYSGFQLQDTPRIYVSGIAGKWLRAHVTPSWRAKDLEEGWQRVVDKDRTKEIAARVLAQGRTFPNAVILGTDNDKIKVEGSEIVLPEDVKFLVIDGQHRIYAQRWSQFEASYACVLHVGISEVDMARLFIEINNNQKRVPASLRWDLVRLIRPKDDEHGIRASEILYELVTQKKGNPLFQRVDLTGENPALALKQASLAPEIKSLVSNKKSPLYEQGELQMKVLEHYFSAIKEVDPDGWKSSEGALAKARIIRALLQLLPEIMEEDGMTAETTTVGGFYKRLKKIKLTSLTTERVRHSQGNAGIVAIREEIKGQIL